MIQTPTTAQATTVISSLAWNPDGTLLALGGGFEGQRALWLVDESGQLVQQFDAPFGAFGVSWRSDGAQLASSGSDGYTIRDVNSGKVLVNFGQAGATADPFTHWNPANLNQIATVEADLVHLRDASTGEIQATLDGPGGRPDSVLSIGWSEDGTTLYTVSNDNLIRVWDVSTTTLLSEIPFNFGAQAFAMSPDKTQLAIAGQDELIHIYDTSGTLLTSFGDLPSAQNRTDIVYLQWHPDGSQVAGVDNIAIYVWEIATGQLVTTIPHQTTPVAQRAVAFNANGALTYPNSDGTALLSPIADAGPDQTVTDSDESGIELVTLDGSGSTDIDGTIVAYSWYENDLEIATGVSPQIELDVGTHKIILKVMDDDGAMGGDVVVVNVEAPP